MPAERNVSWSQLKIGITAMVALVVLAALIFLLTGSRSIFEKDVRLRTYMEDASGMVSGAPVRLNGILVGHVAAIRLSGLSDPRRVVEFDMDVLQKFVADIPEDSVAGISASNLLGDKFLNITKGKSPRHVQPNGELR